MADGKKTYEAPVVEDLTTNLGTESGVPLPIPSEIGPCGPCAPS